MLSAPYACAPKAAVSADVFVAIWLPFSTLGALHASQGAAFRCPFSGLVFQLRTARPKAAVCPGNSLLANSSRWLTRTLVLTTKSLVREYLAV